MMRPDGLQSSYIEPMHKKSETSTERRRFARYRAQRVLNARKTDSVTPDMNLGWSLRALGDGQKRMLDLLLQVFESHPKTQDEVRIIELMTESLLKESEK